MSEQFKFTTDDIANLNKLVFIAVVIVAIGIAIIYQMIASNNADLLKTGIREQMVVIHKYKTGKNRKFSTAQYSLQLDGILSSKKIPLYESKDTIGMKSSEKLSNKILTEIFKDKGRIRVKRKYEPFKIRISGKTFSEIRIGSIVTLVYHKNKPEKGTLLRELE